MYGIESQHIVDLKENVKSRQTQIINHTYYSIIIKSYQYYRI